MIVFPKLLCYSTIIEVVKLKKNKNELVKKGNSTLKEFKQFISKGNVIDLAVGVIIGSAFGNRDHTTVMNAWKKKEKLLRGTWTDQAQLRNQPHCAGLRRRPPDHGPAPGRHRRPSSGRDDRVLHAGSASGQRYDHQDHHHSF